MIAFSSLPHRSDGEISYLFLFSVSFLALVGFIDQNTNMADNKLTIDLDQFKLYLHGGRQMDICLHFDSPSRRFYLTVIALIVNEMKRLNRVMPVSLNALHETLSLLNETVGSYAGSSKKDEADRASAVAESSTPI